VRTVAAQLKAFPERIRLQEWAGARAGRRKDEDGGRNVAEEVKNDHAQYEANLLLSRRDEMQARVQHEALPCHHALPADVDESD